MFPGFCVQFGRFPDVRGDSEDDVLALNPNSMSGTTSLYYFNIMSINTFLASLC